MWRSLFVAALLLAGCKAQDGETLRKVARKTGEKVAGAARPLGDAASPLRGPLAEPGVAARVESRLRTDRYLAPYPFAVRGDSGSVTVTATVPEQSLKARALDLARSTLGVEDVLDDVKVAP